MFLVWAQAADIGGQCGIGRNGLGAVIRYFEHKFPLLIRCDLRDNSPSRPERNFKKYVSSSSVQRRLMRKRHANFRALIKILPLKIRNALAELCDPLQP